MDRFGQVRPSAPTFRAENGRDAKGAEGNGNLPRPARFEFAPEFARVNCTLGNAKGEQLRGGDGEGDGRGNEVKGRRFFHDGEGAFELAVF